MRILAHPYQPITLLAVAFAVVACGTPASRQASPDAPGIGTGESKGIAQPTRVTIAIGAEVNSLATKFEGGNTYSSEFHFMTNSPLTLRDGRGIASPLLAQALPSRDNGTWTVNPDGSMATTWRIKPNARWHDGRPVVAADFAFALAVYTNEALALRNREPENLMERLDRVDDGTFVIRWKQPYPWANELGARELEALPEHLMGRVYETVDPETFLNHTFWSSPSYVGTGPYSLVQWDPGSQLVYRAFPDYFMGRPKIDEVIFRIIPDSGTVVANVLAGTVDATVGITLGQQGGVTVKHQWAPTGSGDVIVTPVRWRYTQIQFDPARSQQPALSDVRVRRALVHGVDRATLAEIVTEGTAGVADVPVTPGDARYGTIDAAVVKYAYDPNRAFALLQEAGWTQRGEILANASAQPFVVELRTTQASDNESEMGIMAADLRKLGMQIAQTVVPQSRIRDAEYRVTFPGLNNTAQSIDVPGTLAVATSDQCAVPERRYIGGNRGCWKNAEFDRLYLLASASLEAAERDRAFLGMVRILTEDVGVFGLSYNSENLAVRKGLVGPVARWPAQIGNTWNIHEWYWSS